MEPHVAHNQVLFELEVDDGWPPVSGERVWVKPLGSDLYVVDSAPWFVRDIAVGDTIRAVADDEESVPVFQELMERSEHVTIQLVCFRSGPLDGDVERALEVFARLGVEGEGLEQFGMLALDIKPTDPLAEVYAVLTAGVANGSWDYSEGRVTDEWLAITANDGPAES